MRRRSRRKAAAKEENSSGLKQPRRRRTDLNAMSHRRVQMTAPNPLESPPEPSCPAWSPRERLQRLDSTDSSMHLECGWKYGQVALANASRPSSAIHWISGRRNRRQEVSLSGHWPPALRGRPPSGGLDFCLLMEGAEAQRTTGKNVGGASSPGRIAASAGSLRFAGSAPPRHNRALRSPTKIEALP